MTSKSTTTLWRRMRPSLTNSSGRTTTTKSEKSLLEHLHRSLKAATASRNRLTHLAPNIFSLCADVQDSCEEDWAWLREYMEALRKFLVEKKDIPEPPPAANSKNVELTNKPRHIPPDENGTPLECHVFQSLATEKKTVIKDAYLAWQTWDYNLGTNKQEFETRHPKWQDDKSPSSAELRQLWSRYNQSLLGHSSCSAKGFLEDTQNSAPRDKLFDHKIFMAQQLAKYGPPPEGIPIIEHLARASAYYKETDLKVQAVKKSLRPA
ncbi:MAG TPA: hypothetical protein VMZ27_13915 [Candidatus Saccharimonadales bacterium]|nr:hypothetical protein [Candidatus Saccharimonadales bacterium]